jgi:peroxin-5
MDEREDAAMRALSEGVRRAQEAGNNGEGMLVSREDFVVF